MSEPLQSRPYRPQPDKCCERCVFGTGAHARQCPHKQIDSAKQRAQSAAAAVRFLMAGSVLFPRFYHDELTPWQD